MTGFYLLPIPVAWVGYFVGAWLSPWAFLDTVLLMGASGVTGMFILVFCIATAIPTTLPAHRPPAVERAHALRHALRAGHHGCGAEEGEGNEVAACRV